MRRLACALLVSLVAPAALRAQSPALVKDINTSTAAFTSSSNPTGFFRFGSRIFFAATASARVGLYSTDGTAAGTGVVADLFSGSLGPNQFINVNGKLLFNARDARGEELWTSDGTLAGTKLVADINAGLAGSFPGDRIVYHGQMIFAADDGVDGRELWITDGTPAGTRFLKDLVSGLAAFNPHLFVQFNDLVYFATSDALWKTDGTAAGTVKVKTLFVYGLTVAGSRMFLSAYTLDTPTEPWVSDGTEAGTHPIAGAALPGPTLTNIAGITALGDKALFREVDSQHGQEYWITDGTAAGTHILRDINPGPGGSIDSSDSIVVAGDVAYFSAITPAEGRELWRTDGTEAGTKLVRDIFPGSDGSFPSGLVSTGDRVFFSATNGDDRTLWITDGTTAGTRPVKTTSRLPISSNGMTTIDGILYFGGANTLNGFEPWKSDGTDAGTSMIANINRDSAPSSIPRNLTAAGDWIYFNAWDGIGTLTDGGQPRSLWRSDGTPEGTLKLIETTVTDYVAAGRSIFFNKDNQLWTSNGTPEGTFPAGQMSGRFPATPSIVFVDGDKIFANVVTSTSFSSSVSLWMTTTAPNASAVSLGAPGSNRFTAVAGRVMFFTSGNGLWTSDGTPAGTYAVVPDVGGNFSSRAVAAGYFYFDTSGTGGTKLWKSDGTFDGTTVVKAFSSSTQGLRSLTVIGRNLYFLIGPQLWVTDGTEAGTRTLSPQTSGVLATAGDRVIFVSVDDTNGAEIWGTDGTVEGTHIVRDIYPGAPSSFPGELTSFDGAVYFTASDPVHGTEMWVTDGTSEGTKLVADIEPGFNSSNPQQYVRAGNRLFFVPTTSATGVELWSLFAPPSTPRLTMNDIRVAEGDLGTAPARFTVSLSAPSTQTVTVDYATSDGTALAGSDYNAASGTLTFAAGETSKNIDVLVRGDGFPENNETFALTLRNASGATLPNTPAYAIIDDDDRSADLALSLDFSIWNGLVVNVNGTNNGPSAATNLKILHTVTPADVAASTCTSTCLGPPPLVLSGATARVFDYSWFGYQQYLSATATIHERDPQPSNNSVGWITNFYVAMDALFLTPGSRANVWFQPPSVPLTVTVTASDAAVITVPSTLTITENKPVSFIARGVAVGTATIQVSASFGTIGVLTVDVVNPGTKLRWPGGVNVNTDSPVTSFDRPAGFSIFTVGTVPYTGEKATGVVTVSANGRELGRITLAPESAAQRLLTASSSAQRLPIYLPALGVNALRLDYSGDANFLPMTSTYNLTATTGLATILGGVEREGTTAKVHFRVTGSPESTPTGTIRISEAGVIAPIDIPLTATATPGTAQAEITLTNVSAAPHTLFVTYSGDGHYGLSAQNIRIIEGRNRAVRR
jgi:ELWxxDGT repeat protein